MDVIGIFRVILGYFLILFVPGYALTWALYPSREELDFVERIALSSVLSIVTVMVSVLFADVYLGIDLTSLNIVMVIAIVTIMAAAMWWIQALYIKRSLKNGIVRKAGRGLKDTEEDVTSESVKHFWNIK
jgi:uncharacterized membrane protein